MTRDARLQVFISYRSETVGTARALHAAIERYANRVGSVFYSDVNSIGNSRAERSVTEVFRFAICLSAGEHRRKRRIKEVNADAAFFRDEIVAVIKNANVVALSWFYPLRDLLFCHSCDSFSPSVCDTSKATDIGGLLGKSALAIGQVSGQAKCSILAGFNSEQRFRADAVYWQATGRLNVAGKPWGLADDAGRRAARPGAGMRRGRANASPGEEFAGIAGVSEGAGARGARAGVGGEGVRGDEAMEDPAYPISEIHYKRSCPNQPKLFKVSDVNSGHNLAIWDDGGGGYCSATSNFIDGPVTSSSSVPYNSFDEGHISVSNIGDYPVAREVDSKGISSLGVQMEGVRRVLAAEQEAGQIRVPTSCEVEQTMLTGRKKNGSLSGTMPDTKAGTGRSKPENRPASGLVGEKGRASDAHGVGREEAVLLTRPAEKADVRAEVNVVPFVPREPGAEQVSTPAGEAPSRTSVEGAGNVVEFAAVLKERSDVLAEPDALEWPGPNWNGRLSLDSYEDDVRELMELLAEEDGDDPECDGEPSGSLRPRGG